MPRLVSRYSIADCDTSNRLARRCTTSRSDSGRPCKRMLRLCPEEVVRHEQFGGEVVGLDFLFVAGGAAGGVAEVEPDQTFEDQVMAVVQSEMPEFVPDRESLPH
jgi:hypothetical protein